jgi:hypothetical protein
MARLVPILRCQWRAYWRRFARSGNLNAGNQGVLLIVSLLALYRFTGALRPASGQLPNGKTSTLQVILFGIFFVWLFPLMSNARLSFATHSLKHLPLTSIDLFALRSASLFITPFSWLVIGASFAVVYPILFAPNPLSGVAALLLFIAFCWSFGLALAQLLTISFWRQAVVLSIVLVTAIVLYLLKFRHWNYLDAFEFFPATLVASAAVGDRVWPQLTVLLALTALAVFAALWSYQLSLDNIEPGNSNRKTFLPLFRGKTGPLSAKDIRYFRRLFDPYLGLFVSCIGCFYLLAAPVPTAEVFGTFIIVVVFPNASLAFNSFGLDNRQAADRYSLLPLSGEEIILSKNIAYCATVGIQLLPLMVLAAIRIGISAVMLGFVETLLLLLGYLSWGNVVSINHRFKMQFYRFSSGGSPVEGLVGVSLGTLPGVVALQLFYGGIWWVSLLVLILYGTMYSASLLWAAKQWRRRRAEAWS